MTGAGSISAADLAVRHFVYRHFVGHARPPTAAETAQAFSIPISEAEAAYQRLHNGHFFFLGPGCAAIRMANPFSAAPTPFRVRIQGRRYFANCAWDMLGIPAAIGLDAEVEAICADCGAPARFQVRSGGVEPDQSLVHFLLPFTSWYDDLVFT